MKYETSLPDGNVWDRFKKYLLTVKYNSSISYSINSNAYHVFNKLAN